MAGNNIGDPILLGDAFGEVKNRRAVGMDDIGLERPYNLIQPHLIVSVMVNYTGFLQLPGVD